MLGEGKRKVSDMANSYGKVVRKCTLMSASRRGYETISVYCTARHDLAKRSS